MVTKKISLPVVALDVLVVLCLLYGDDLVDASLSGGRDGADVQGRLAALALAGDAGVTEVVVVGVGVVVVVVLGVAGAGSA